MSFFLDALLEVLVGVVLLIDQKIGFAKKNFKVFDWILSIFFLVAFLFFFIAPIFIIKLGHPGNFFVWYFLVFWFSVLVFLALKLYFDNKYNPSRFGGV